LTILHIYQVFLLDKKLKQKVIHFTVAQLSLIVPGLVLIIPYILNFSPPVGGIGIVPLDVKSPITPWLQMWGMFLIIFAVYIILRLIKKINFDPEKLKLRTETWVFVLLLIGFALLIGVEFLFIKDIFFESNGDYFRTNTVFKFYYHVWVIWGVVAGYFAVKIFTDIKKNNVIINYLAFAVLGILSVFSVSYIDKAINDFYFNEKEKTLDGIAFIKDEYPNDYDAINWINENIQEQSIIAEAVGNAYTYYARISTTTGNQTVIGWPTHEWQWRGEPEPVFARQSRIQRLYESINEGEVTSIIKDFDIEYIYVGELEKSTYTDLTEKIFEDIGEIVYDENGTRIYKILE
jgi:uncharacterized membrane protein